MAASLVHESFIDPIAIAREARTAVTQLVATMAADADVRDQLRRTSLTAWVQTSEAVESFGAERLARFRVARDQAGEAASIIEGALAGGRVDAVDAQPALAHLHRLCAILATLARGRPR